MALLTIRDLTIRFRGPALLDGVDCLVESGDRIGLLGRNGAGKTTFLKLISKQLEPDNGVLQLDSGAKMALLQQAVPHDLAGSVREVVLTGVGGAAGSEDDIALAAESDWEAEHKVDQILSRMELDPDAEVASMSSGMKRRVLLARALVDQPELLLLDEPTNHLDIAAITWLEDFLRRWNGTLIFITHDRQFLRRLANRILEIEGGRLFDWSCDYDTFLKRKVEALAAEEKQQALFDKKLAEEEVWIRQGIKARRTRNEGRVRALKELRRQRSERRSKVGTTNLQIQEGMRSGNLVANLEEVSFAHKTPDGELPILTKFSTTIMRGDKVGIVGRNGAGKTTLLKILLGQLAPQSGNVRMGTNLQVAYFDQLRDQLDEDKTVEEDVSDGYQTINVDGNSRHVLGYLQDFLFTPERARTPIKQLSGGERNRVLLAKLFAKPANVIVLDEPTNDLDAETLEMLEERLVNYSGTLIVVSHDREFLNNVVMSCIVFEPSDEGRLELREYVGGYDEWQRQYAERIAREKQAKQDAIAASAAESASGEKKTGVGKQSVAPEPKPVKLSFKESKELESLPGKIEALEAEIQTIEQKISDPGFYKQDGKTIADVQANMKRLADELANTMERWESLESRV